MKNSFKAVLIYQILAWSYAITLFILLFVRTLATDVILLAIIIQMLYLCIGITILYTSFCLIFNINRNHTNLYLNINIWSNFFQVFYISLLGVTYYTSIGLHVCIYFVYENNWDILISKELIDASYAVKYANSNLISAGINIAPLICFIILEKVKKEGLIDSIQ